MTAFVLVPDAEPTSLGETIHTRSPEIEAFSELTVTNASTKDFGRVLDQDQALRPRPPQTS